MPTVNTYDRLIGKPWVYHSLFWLVYYCFAVLISLTIHQVYGLRFYLELLTLLPPDMLLVYIHLYVLIPAFLLKRKFFGYFTGLLLLVTSLSALNILLHHWYGRAGSAIFAATGEFNVYTMATQILNGIYLLGISTALKYMKDWMIQRQELQERQRQQVAMELNFLKSQIHPHFFFNTLNNLYSLTLQKSDLAPGIVLQLSDLMSYMLYESAAPLVPLEKEMASLDSYLALERLRFGSRLTLSFEKEGIPAAIRIPPLILLTFVENSFKHGINQLLGEGRIAISLKYRPPQLCFTVDNSIPASAVIIDRSTGSNGADAAAAASTKTAAGATGTGSTATFNGIGLSNTIRRLDLLYGARYRLDLSGSDGNFHVSLNIPIS